MSKNNEDSREISRVEGASRVKWTMFSFTFYSAFSDERQGNMASVIVIQSKAGEISCKRSRIPIIWVVIPERGTWETSMLASAYIEIKSVGLEVEEMKFGGA